MIAAAAPAMLFPGALPLPGAVPLCGAICIYEYIHVGSFDPQCNRWSRVVSTTPVAKAAAAAEAAAAAGYYHY